MHFLSISSGFSAAHLVKRPSAELASAVSARHLDESSATLPFAGRPSEAQLELRSALYQKTLETGLEARREHNERDMR